MTACRKNAIHTAEWFKNHIRTTPETAIMTGTGLSECAETLAIEHEFHYSDIPHFPVSTVLSHHGQLIFGTMGKRHKKVMVLQGRFHLYEGYSPLEVTFPVRVMQEIGIKNLILTNAAGGLNLSYSAGDIMIIEDHINLTGENPLTGPNEDAWGKRFPDMIDAYDKDLIHRVESTAKAEGIAIQKGVYAGLKGPSLETPAEMTFLRTIGADAVGFSTIQEVIAAVHSGFRVLGLSIITNMNDPAKPVPATLEGVIKTAEKAAPYVNRLIDAILEIL
ncbi:MAG: purine-nucleoside phosphorylase [Proteobacteria bacterium]|nr:purine-nucleoside phosphorylase [Pseudomonadota bacterium]